MGVFKFDGKCENGPLNLRGGKCSFDAVRLLGGSSFNPPRQSPLLTMFS